VATFDKVNPDYYTIVAGSEKRDSNLAQSALTSDIRRRAPLRTYKSVFVSIQGAALHCSNLPPASETRQSESPLAI
jgi:hypothetical protein